ncbi:MAG TPA: VOC family protein [Vicinamibacterales bacterium]|nr:VOC family protein [Vicinamibacterales bacterium]
MTAFALTCLDHVAIAVTDVERSAAWYEDVLGLTRMHDGVWGGVPTVVAAGSSGLALFPVQGSSPRPRPGRDVLTMRHFAFRTDAANFALVKAELTRRKIAFVEQDHQIARSIYLTDPDGHEVEITTYEVA